MKIKIMGRFKLCDSKVVDMYHFRVVQGKFLDTIQEENGHEKRYVYASINDLQTSDIEDSEVTFFAYGFDEVYDPNEYMLHELGLAADEDDVMEQLLESDAYKKYKSVYRTNRSSAE